MLNLPDPPPHFQALNSDKPVQIYQRSLPHWRQEDATYFVTFRLGDSLPQEKLRYLQRLREEWTRTHPGQPSNEELENHTRTLLQQAEKWLDEGYGSCLLANGGCAKELEDAILRFQHDRYFVSCYVVMPNHCHLSIKPLGQWDLGDILQPMKGVAAHRINKLRGTSGSIWQDESYDRIIRDREQLWRVIQYIGKNPKLSNIPVDAWQRWVHPDWVACGWGFRDE
jgi:putative transposase